MNNFRIIYHENLTYQPNTHIQYEIINVIEGCLFVCVNGNDIAVTGGQAIFLPPYFVHAFSTDLVSKCYIWEFDSSVIPERLPEDVILFSVKDNPEAIVYDEKNKDNIFAQKSGIYKILSFMNRGDAKKYSPVSADLCFGAIKFIAENFRQPITLKDAAKHLCVNYSYLSRVFNERQNISFTECLNGTRLNHAIPLLNETDMSVTEIAHSSGFGSVRSFNRIFLEKMNCTPYELRTNRLIHNK